MTSSLKRIAEKIVFIIEEEYPKQKSVTGSIQSIYQLANEIVESGEVAKNININAIDKYGSVALIYSLTVLKLTTQDAYPIYELLLKHNADYTLKNDAGKSALDYAKELSWKNDFLNILEKYENESK